MGVYEICNLHDGKTTSYVGSSVNIGTRWRQHVWALRRGRHHNSRLQRAWDEYGEGAFSFCVLEQVADTASLPKREQHWLDYMLEITDDYYNLAQDVAAPMLGRYHTEETRHKMGVARNQWSFSETTKHRLSRAATGRRLSGDTKHKISVALTGRELSEEHRRRVSQALSGRKLSREHRRKLSVASAKPYPAFVNRETGETILAGIDLTRLCRERGLNRGNMGLVVHGQRNHHKGWTLANNMEE